MAGRDGSSCFRPEWSGALEKWGQPADFGELFETVRVPLFEIGRQSPFCWGLRDCRQVFVGGFGGFAAFGDGPYDQRLSSTGVAGSEDAGD
jgi:hypothetical protein